MRVIGVLDLADGRAVHARAGRREHYRPVAAVAGSTIQPGDALALADGYIERLNVEELYAADLDSILGRGSQDALLKRLVNLGAPLWLDIGAASVAAALHVLQLGAAHVVVGLETLQALDVLKQICEQVGGNRVAFSLDLQDGKPIVRPAASIRVPSEDAVDFVTACAVEAGVGSLIVIDLARVGTRRGLDFGLIRRLRDATPGLGLVAGGGVRGLDDLIQLAAAGCDAALVATALQDGRLDPVGIAAACQAGRA